MITIINQIFSLEEKIKKDDNDNYNRYFERIYHELEVMEYDVINPIGKPYRNEMTDMDANVTGELSSSSKITKVLKPIIYQVKDNQTQLLQKGIVIVD